MGQRLSDLFVHATHSVREAMACLDRTAMGIVFLVDDRERLRYTVTDGDIRRALLAGCDLDDPLFDAIPRGLPDSANNRPLSAPEDTPDDAALAMMQERGVRHLPLVDGLGKVVGLRTLADLLGNPTAPVDAVVMAGGFGTRLRPLTDSVPKPMLPVGDRPVMEHILMGLRDAGIHEVHVTTHYRPEAITGHFGDGSALGLSIRYVNETRPLGTAGALGLLGDRPRPVLVVNGDVLCNVDYRALTTFHQDSGAELTVGVRRYELGVPYGVVELDGSRVRALREKPTYRVFVNAGVYLMEPTVFDLITPGERLDATDLIERLIDAGRTVVSFPIHEYWLDIGQPMDYDRAQRDWPPQGRATSA